MRVGCLAWGGLTRVDSSAGGDHDDVAMGRGRNQLLDDEWALQLNRGVVGRLWMRGKAQELELGTFEENRRAVGMLD